MPRCAVLILFAALLLVPRGALAQEPADTVPRDSIYRLVLSDGSSFYGYVESRGEEVLVFRTLGGTRIEVDPAQVRSLELARGRVVEGEIWPEDPNDTRLFFGPTARSLDSGDGYVGLFELFFLFGAYGVGDHVVLAGGTPVVPGAIGQVLYLAPKVRLFSASDVDVALGGIAFFLTEALDQGSLGLVYGVGTWGGERSALTAGAGWAFAWGWTDAAFEDDPVLLLGGEHRVSRGIKLMSENYVSFVSGAPLGVMSGGVRFMGERFSADLGLGAGVAEGSTGCCLPILSASYSF